jgi:putative hydrolase of the HAD superfamily
MMIKYIFFDVAGTLLGKPLLFERLGSVLLEHGYNIDFTRLKFTHKILSEVIHFPDKTDKDFYDYFNAELLVCLGIIPTQHLLDDIFGRCTYLPWEPFEDSNIVKELNQSIGVISNFNTSLKSKLIHHFGDVFRDVFVSEEVGLAKPNVAFYQYAIQRTGLKPEEILYIGDSMKLDIIPTQSLGMRSLLIDRDGLFMNSPYTINSLQHIKNHLN